MRYLSAGGASTHEPLSRRGAITRAGQPLTRFLEAAPRFAGFVEEPDGLTLHVNPWPGDAPEPPNDIPRTIQRKAARHGPSPEARGRTQDPHDRRARGACLHALEILTSDSAGVSGVPRVHIDIGVHVHGITASMCAGRSYVCRCPRCGCTTPARTAVPFQRVRSWRGATPPCGCLIGHGDGRDVHGHPNLAQGRSPSISPCGIPP